MEDIDFNDPSLYIIGGSLIVGMCLIGYHCYNCYNTNEQTSEIQLTTQKTKQDFSDINDENEEKTTTDLEAQQRTTETQTEDVEFYNIMGSQIDKYIQHKRRRNVYEYADSD